MEKDEQFLHGFFLLVSQLCFDKAKEHVEKEKEGQQIFDSSQWIALLNQLLQLSMAEKNYMEIGFLQNKNKGFLRKDNSLQANYDAIRQDVKRTGDLCRNLPCDYRILLHCKQIEEFIIARNGLIQFTQGKTKLVELMDCIETLNQKCVHTFADISLTPIKAVFSLECTILEQLFRALIELQRLQFLPSLAHIHGAHTRLQAWENTKIKHREVRKLGFIKTNQLPALFQWHLSFKGAVLSKFSLLFHDTLASQTTSNDMRMQCAKLHYDYYQKMQQFQKRYDVTSIMLVSDSQITCETSQHDAFPIIVACPARPPMMQIEDVLKMVIDAPPDTEANDNVIYKYSSQDKLTCIYIVVEPSIYLICLLDGKKIEREVNISNFLVEFAANLRCTKVFCNLKRLSK